MVEQCFFGILDSFLRLTCLSNIDISVIRLSAHVELD